MSNVHECLAPATTRVGHASRWHDLAALLDPAGRLADPLAAARPLDWVGLYRLASAQLVAPHLYARLAARGCLDRVPGEVREALAGLHWLNAQRNERLRAVLRDTVRLLNAAGIEPLLLKGAIALLPDQYPQAGARMLSDLDLALMDAEATEAEALLRAAGYRDADNIPDPDHYTLNHHHLAPLFHPSGDGYVELHRNLLVARVPTEALSLEQVRAAATPLDWEGARVWVPSLEHRLLHNALHHQVQNDAFCNDQRDLRQMLEFAQLGALPGAAAIDWAARLARLDRLGCGSAVRAYFLAGNRLFAQPLPAGVQPDWAARWAEWRFWWLIDHPRWRPVLIYARRLPNLPRRLVTPSWYPEKVRYLRQQWFAGRRVQADG